MPDGQTHLHGDHAFIAAARGRRSILGCVEIEFREVEAHTAASPQPHSSYPCKRPPIGALANARTLVRLQAQAGKSKAYWYYFTHVSPIPKDAVRGGRPAPSWGVYHGSEIVYVFNAFPFQDWEWRPVDLKLGDTISSIWVNFVKTGSPNGAGRWFGRGKAGKSAAEAQAE